MTEQSKQEPPSNNPINPIVNNSEIKQETQGIVDRAINAAERLEAANKKMEELITKNEAVLSRQLLAGKSDGGAEKPKTSIEIAQEKANETMRRFGYKR